jgi:hypothetical protein
MLDRKPGTCDVFTGVDMPLMVAGAMTDTHFYEYQLQITGNGYGIHPYSPVAFYDDPTDNVIGTGTIKPPPFVDLHQVSVYDLTATPIKCGYTVLLTGWDRTVWCGFSYGANWASRCVGCRHNSDAWTFEFTP